MVTSALTSVLTKDALTSFARANRSRFEGLLRDFVECPTVSVDPERKSSIADVRRLEDLPANARCYLDRIQALVETPIRFVSVGTRRDQIIETA